MDEPVGLFDSVRTWMAERLVDLAIWVHPDTFYYYERLFGILRATNDRNPPPGASPDGEGGVHE